MSIPNEFMCPISMDLMTDPVVAPDGHTYERAVITEWLHTNNVSPLTRHPMTVSDLQPNFALRSAIERWKLSNEPMPTQNDIPLIVDEKSFNITGHKLDEHSMYLDIKTTYNTPMESVLIAVIDVSGSMDGSASNKRQTEGDEFSRLDLVKHSLTTLANLLNSEYKTTQSSLGIVSFSNSARVVMPITKMDTVGLNTATTAINTIRSEGATNIWDGLRMGLLQAITSMERNPNANIQLLLLTDGEPTTDLLPPLGIKSTLKRKLDTLKGRVTISTFGFGYNLDCNLLEEICELGNGTYGFIPDCSMVGTIFINWASKALLTLAHHITIKTPLTSYQVGDIIVGRSQKLVLPYSRLSKVEVTYDNGKSDEIQLTMIDEFDKNVIYLDKLTEAVKNLKKYRCYDSLNTDGILALKNEILSLESQTDFMKDIVADIESEDDNEGQLMKACINKWWHSWGRSHLIAYYHALKLQQCVNFKDKALQHFASDEFKALQEKGIDIFSNLPAPTPSSHNYRSLANGLALGGFRGGNAPNPQVPVSIFDSADIRTLSIMSNYVSSAGPCFTGDCKVLMKDTGTKFVRDLRKGDEVWGGYKVEAVLFTPVQKEVDMITFPSGLKITPWHPMKLTDDGEWVFPNDVGTKKQMTIHGYYNLVLDSGHIVELNGFKVVTLGHEFIDNDVIKHPYFGTHAVIDDLKKHPTWQNGYLVMDSKNIVRNSETGLVQKI
jgi:Mg-chelatase subunit ChlD